MTSYTQASQLFGYILKMKVLLKISLGLLVLILIAVAGFALTFNPNDYKKNIIALVKEKYRQAAQYFRRYFIIFFSMDRA